MKKKLQVIQAQNKKNKQKKKDVVGFCRMDCDGTKVTLSANGSCFVYFALDYCEFPSGPRQRERGTVHASTPAVAEHDPPADMSSFHLCLTEETGS